jgi:hypothetical protein
MTVVLSDKACSSQYLSGPENVLPLWYLTKWRPASFPDK